MRQHPNKFYSHSKEAVAAGVSAALLLALGGMAAKASAASEKETAKNTPHLVASGLGPEHSQAPLPWADPAWAEKLTLTEYKVAKQVFNHANNGPANENIIDVGGMRLMPGTKIYRAPMESAVDHVIDKKHVEFWSLERLMQVNGKLWAAAVPQKFRKGEGFLVPPMDTMIEPRYSLWVNISEAEKVPGFEHLVPMGPDISRGAKPWKLPPVFQIKPNDQGRIMITQPHPNEFSDPRYLANSRSYDVKYMNESGWEFSINGMVFIPTNKPVRFMKAKVPTYQGPGE